MAMHIALWKSVKSWIGLQSQPYMIQKLISGQTEIKKTTRHWFMKSIVRSMEINTLKLGTTSRISRCDQIENGQQIWWVHYPTPNIENKHHIRWQIMHVCPTQTTQSISNKLLLHAFHSVNTNIIEQVPHKTCVFQFWMNQRREQRL
jgi:hypothetical protein